MILVRREEAKQNVFDMTFSSQNMILVRREEVKQNVLIRSIGGK